MGMWRFFIFIFFIFVFYKNIFSFSKFTGISPAAPLPGGRGFCAKNFVKIFARRAAGRPAPRPPGCRATVLHPALAAHAVLPSSLASYSIYLLDNLRSYSMMDRYV